MAHVGENVQFGFHSGLLVLEIKRGHALGDVRAVAITAGDEERRHAFLHREQIGRAWVDQGLKIRA